MNALSLRGVEKSFESPVLRGVDLDIDTGAFVALLGPSGCGKTTLLRLIAGFERADGGTVEIAGQPIAGPGLHLPPERRGVGVVPQEGALFPHLSVRANVAFGLARQVRPGSRADELLELVGLPGFGERMPHELSGGQQQRVAVARALAPEPSLILLDEPFSALDAGLRAQVRGEVKDCLKLAGATALLVTHDQQEALSVADMVAVMREGRVVQAGTPSEVYSRPVDLGVATFVGEAVLLPGMVTAGVVTCSLGSLPTQGPDGPATVLLRPEQLELDSQGVDAIVIERLFYGHDALLRLLLPDGATVTARTSGRPLPDAGAVVRVGCRGAVTSFATGVWPT